MWLKSLFCCCKKKPLIKITILTILLNISNTFAARKHLEYVFAYFVQNEIESIDHWTVHWYNPQQSDSMNIYKNDTLRVKIFNSETNKWVIYTDNIGDSLRFKMDRPINLNVEWTFYLVAKDVYGSLINGDPVKTYFIASDINKINKPDVEGGFYLGDHTIDGLDLLELSKKWGASSCQYKDFFDITGDGYVDGMDLIQLSKDWGKTWLP